MEQAKDSSENSQKNEQDKEKALRFGAAFRLFDRGVITCINEQKNKLNKACDKVQIKINSLESKISLAFDAVRKQCDKDLDLADELIHKEMRSKLIISQWTNGFLADSTDITLDPISFAFSRFCLNMSLCYSDVTAQYILQSKVHILLVGLMTFDSELIVGPAIMATTHISLYSEVKPELILAGVLPALLKIFVRCNSQSILTQACKLCASLALYPPNKSHLASSGLVHVLLDLTGGAHKVVNKFTQLAAATALVNTIYQSDTNRSLIIELDGVRPIMNAIRLTSDNSIILQCIKAITNIVLLNSFTASKFLNAAADGVIVEVLQSCDIHRVPSLVHACLTVLANMCYSENTQSHVASGGCVDCAVLILRNGR